MKMPFNFSVQKMPRTSASAIHPPPPLLLLVLLFLLYFIAFSFPTASAYKVLVYSASMSKSHLISNARVADALARDGHDVTLVEVEYQVPLDSLNASKLARVWRIPGKFFKLGGDGAAEAAAVDIQSMVVQLAFQRPSLRGAWNRQFMFRKFHSVFNDACKRLVTTQRWQLDLLAAEKFDLFIGEQYDFCGAGLSHALGIPTFVLVHSCPIQENIASLRGLPNPSSWVPTLQSDTSDRMSMLGRMQNLLAQMEMLWWNTDIGDASPLDPFFRQHFGADFPGVLHIVREAPFMFVNVDEFVDFPRPLFPNIVYIGGLGMEQREAETAARLEEPFRTAMAAGGSKGVVLFSLGSILRSSDLPRAFLRNIFEAFAAFPDYQFIVKAETEDNFTRQLADRICGGAGGNGTGNVLLANWLPQLELINHPRLRLFISHGGYNSLMEVARAGVPLIAMGFFGDQYRNARAAERNGWALAFDKFKLLEGSQEFKAAIARVLEEPSFTIKAKRIQRLIQTKPFSAEDRLLKSIRFLELNGGRLPELLAESRNMSTVALYNLDLLALAATCLALLLTTIRQFTKWVWRRRRSWLLIGMGGGAQKTGKRKAE